MAAWQAHFLANPNWPQPSSVALTDDFERPDSTDLGTNWTEVAGDSQIVTGTLQPTAGGVLNFVRHNTATLGGNQYSRVVAPHAAAIFTDVGATVQNNPTGRDCYVGSVKYDSDSTQWQARIFRIDNAGNFVSLSANVLFDEVAPLTIELTYNPDTDALVLKVNGTSRVTHTDATLGTFLHVGAYMRWEFAGSNANNARINEWAGGDNFIAHAQQITDPVAILDDVSYSIAYEQQLTDAVGILDEASRVNTASQEITDPVAIVDDATSALTIPQELTDSVGTIDDAVSVSTADHTYTDPVAALDAVEASATYDQLVTDTADILDSSAVKVVFSSEITDVAAIDDSSALLAEYVQGVDDTVPILDSQIVDNAGNTAQEITDFAVIDDTIEVSGEFVFEAVVTDTLLVADALESVATYQSEFTDSVPIADSVEFGIAVLYEFTVTDSVLVDDAVQHVLSLETTLVNAVFINDTIAQEATINLNVADDVVPVVDTLESSTTFVHEVTDLVDIIDSVSGGVVAAATLTDTVPNVDSVTYTRPLAFAKNLPATLTVNTDEAFTLTVEATGDDPKTYQWQDNSTGAFANITSDGLPSHTVAGLPQTASGRKYRVIVTNPHGSLTSVETEVTVTTVLGRLITDNVPIIEPEGSLVEYIHDHTDTVGAVDDVYYTFFVGGGIAYEQVVIDSLLVSDQSDSKYRVITEELDDDIPILDSLAVQHIFTPPNFNRVISDDIRVTDQTDLPIFLVAEDYTEPIGIADLHTWTVNIVRTLDESIAVVDEANTDRIGALHERTVTDALVILDSLNRAITISQTLTDAVLIIDETTRVLFFDNILTVERLVGGLWVAAIIEMKIGGQWLAMTPTGIAFDKKVTIEEGLSILDAATSALNMSTSLNDGVPILDAVTVGV